MLKLKLQYYVVVNVEIHISISKGVASFPPLLLISKYVFIYDIHNYITIFIIIAINTSNWTEWSTIQGVLARVISKSDEHDYSLNCTTRGPITN